MKDLKICVKCIQPNTRPGIFFNEDSICGACIWEEEKKKIDWSKRITELKTIAENAIVIHNSQFVNTVKRIVNTFWCAFPLLSRISQCSNKGKGQEAIHLHS